MIGQSDYFEYGFTTLNCKLFFWLVTFFLQGKYDSQSSENITRTRRSQLGLSAAFGSTADPSLVAASKLMEIRNEIKDDLQKIKEESTRVCRTALGSVRKTFLTVFRCVILHITLLRFLITREL